MPYKPAMCEWCEGWENDGAIGIIFPSEEDFKDSEYYDGRDQVKGDPVASYAVWPGKNNVGRTPSDWWRCAVVHPFCSHGWEMIDPNQLELDEDFKDFGTELLAEQAEENKKYRFNTLRVRLSISTASWHGAIVQYSEYSIKHKFLCQSVP